MYDQEKIKKMKNHELAMEAYFYAYNHKLFGGASQKRLLNVMNRLFLFWILMKESIYLSYLHLEGAMWQRKSV